MTPKQKANELFFKYYEIIKRTLSTEHVLISKKCALVAIDEIIRSHHNLYGVNNKEVKFYLEVKKEIETL